MRKLAALVLLAAAAGYTPFASAFTDPNGVFSSYTGGKTTIPTPTTNTNWTATPSGSNIKVGVNATVAARNGKTVAVPVFELATQSQARRALGKMARALPAIGTGLVVLDMLREFGILQGATGALDFDAGVSPTMQSVPCWKSIGVAGTYSCSGSPDAAAQAYLTYALPTIGPSATGEKRFTAHVSSTIDNYQIRTKTNPSQAYYDGTGGNPALDGWGRDFYVQNTPTSELRCLDGSLPKRYGKCLGGTITHDISDATVDSDLQVGTAMTQAELATQVTNAMDWQPYPLEEPMSVGPVPDVTISTSTTTDTATPPHTTTTTEKDVGVDDGQGDIDWHTETTTDDGTTTETTTDEKTQLDPCGLPTTPPCAIDEKDTPKKDDLKTATDALKDAATERQGKLPDVTTSTGKNTSWTFSLSFPTACVPLNVDMRFHGKGQIVVLNPCTWIATIHELVSMVWAGATLFLVLGMVGRTLREV